MKYKRVETSNGRVMFFVNGKMTGKGEIPVSVLGQLDGNSEIEINTPAPEVPPTPEEAPVKPEDRKCFIDGEPGKFKKFLELQTVYLCDEHQHSLTTGEVVYEMRKAGLIE